MGRHVWRGLIVLLAAAGCGQTLYPVTNGSYRAIPSEGTPVVIWGVQGAALTGTESWLKHRGLMVLARAKVGQADDKSILSAAAAAGAKLVVFVESGSLPAFPVSLSIRGVAAPSGEELWQASAWYPAKPSQNDDADLESLACQALATVWGFRPAGYHEIPSSNMCAVDETRPKGRSAGGYKEFG